MNRRAFGNTFSNKRLSRIAASISLFTGVNWRQIAITLKTPRSKRTPRARVANRPRTCALMYSSPRTVRDSEATLKCRGNRRKPPLPEIIARGQRHRPTVKLAFHEARFVSLHSPQEGHLIQHPGLTQLVDQVEIETHFAILKHIGKTPSMATCRRCLVKFFVPLELIGYEKEAELTLRSKFAEHVCGRGVRQLLLMPKRP